MEDTVNEEEYEETEEEGEKKGILVKFLVVAGILIFSIGFISLNQPFNFNGSEPKPMPWIPEGKEPINGEFCVFQTFDYKERGSYCEWMKINKNEISTDTMKMQQYALEYLNQQRNSPCSLEFISGTRTDCDSRGRVIMSNVDSAQSKSDNIAAVCGAPSHWDTNGMKPYMTYSFSGGRGMIKENVGGMFSLDDSKDEIFYWTEENIIALIRENIDGMLYHDSHVDWGHRESLLDPLANKVSFGISVTESCASVVIHMERDYIEWDQFPTIVNSGENNQIIFSGTIDQNVVGEEAFQYAMLLVYEDIPTIDKSIIIDIIKRDASPLGYDIGSSCTIIECNSSEMCSQDIICVFPPCDTAIFICPILNSGESSANEWRYNCDGVKCSFSINTNIHKNEGLVTIIFTDFIGITLNLEEFG